jgi:hypothetical protein
MTPTEEPDQETPFQSGAGFAESDAAAVGVVNKKKRPIR